jgi:hypothetical protein
MQVLSPPAASPGGRAWLAQVPLLSAEARLVPATPAREKGVYDGTPCRAPPRGAGERCRVRGTGGGNRRAGAVPARLPDAAHTWRHLLPELAAAGFHAVAPFMRGYAPTAVPRDGNYSIGALVADTLALHQVMGGDEQAVLIGHRARRRSRVREGISRR